MPGLCTANQFISRDENMHAEFAIELYKGMREADRLGFQQLVIQTPEGSGLADAIRDRVEKSAAAKENTI